jgi:hypothetical protein
MIMSTRIGPRMWAIRDAASAVPGISVRGALALADLPLSGPGRDAPVQRAEAAGLVIRVPERRNLHHLFATERDRQRFYLRAELLAPGTTAERVAELAAEIARLDDERAASWID